MMDVLTFDEIINGHGSYTMVYKNTAKAIECVDGTTLSVQAGRMLYSTPRNNLGPYSAVEVGFPSAEPPETWRDYYDGYWDEDETHTGSIFAYIPVELVREYIESHGGEKV